MAFKSPDKEMYAIFTFAKCVANSLQSG